MPQSLAQVWLHIVFSTKERRPFLKDLDFQDQMFRMLAHQVKEAGCISASVGGHFDHVHLLTGLSRTVAISSLIEHIKTKTSRWAKTTEIGVPNFSWQSGYGVFSVSHSKIEDVDNYIRHQAQHHQTRTFQSEFRDLCAKHGLSIDEKYVWD